MSLFLRLLLLAMLAGLTSCQKSAVGVLKLDGVNVSDAGLGGEFNLMDHSGHQRRLVDFRGKVVAILFGYTHCPDVCPTTLLEYSSVAKELGADADKLAVLFISVDPQRDTPEVLAGYVPHFGRQIWGLSGNPGQLASVMRAYRVVARKVAEPGGGYSVDHSAGSYLLDRQGQVRVYEPYGTASTALVHDIRQLLR
jgi:protein SCO1/2